MSKFVTSVDIILLEFNTKRTANSSFTNEVGVICVKNINFASRPYFSEEGNVDDDATFINVLLRYFSFLNSPAASCSLQSAVCSLQSAVCSLQMSYTGFLRPEKPFEDAC